MSIGERIKSVRKAARLTQAEFSSPVCVSRTHISAIESGNDLPSKGLIKLISLEFEVDENWLVSGEGKMYSNGSLDNVAALKENAAAFHKANQRLIEAIPQDTKDWLESIGAKQFDAPMMFYVPGKDVVYSALFLAKTPLNGIKEKFPH